MSFTPYYYNAQTKKILLAFMSFFDGISIEKYQADGYGNLIGRKFIKVPIQYASGDKWTLAYKQGHKKLMDPHLTQSKVELEFVLPRISIYMTTMTYDTMRHLNKQKRLESGPREEGSMTTGYTPVPYTLDVNLSVISRTLDSQFQVIEQILPFFTPSRSMDVNLIPGIPPVSIPVSLSSINNDFPEEMAEDEIRLYTSDLTFMLKALYYPPSRQVKTVKEVDADISLDPTFKKFEQYIQIAINPGPVGEYEDRADTTLNPVTTIGWIDVVKP